MGGGDHTLWRSSNCSLVAAYSRWALGFAGRVVASRPITSSASSQKISQSACTTRCWIPSPKLLTPLLGGFWCFFWPLSLLFQPGLITQLLGALEAGACMSAVPYCAGNLPKKNKNVKQQGCAVAMASCSLVPCTLGVPVVEGALPAWWQFFLLPLSSPAW